MLKRSSKQGRDKRQNDNDSLRKVYLIGDITSVSINTALASILPLVKRSRTRRIVLNLTSSGGSCDAAVAFYQLTKSNGVPLDVDVYHSADSAAVVVLCAGKRRRATASSTFILHSVMRSSQDFLREKDARHLVMVLKHDDEITADIIARTTGQPVEKIAKLMADGAHLTAQEAQELGLIHEIIPV